MNRRRIYSKLAIFVVCTTFLYGCGGDKENSTNETGQLTTIEAKDSILADKTVTAVIGELVTYDGDDLYTDRTSEQVNYIELKDGGSSIKGSGAAEKQGKITVSAAGNYVISGKTSNGQIVVDTEGTVRLILKGAEINCSDSAAIYVKNAKKTIVSLEEGTENIISDGSKYTLEDANSDEPSAAIFSKDDLVINGRGKLIVKANYNDGITSKDDLKITGGNIEITAVDDGIVGKDLLAVKEGTITITAAGDALKASNDKDADKGNMVMENGSFNLKAEKDGIEAENAVLIGDGSFNITTGGGSANAVEKPVEDIPFPMGGQMGNPMGGQMERPTGDKRPELPEMPTGDKMPEPPEMPTGDKGIDIPKGKDNSTTTDETERESTKAIKAGRDIGIAAGTFNLDSADDCIHSNNNVAIEGGQITIASGDDGIHSDKTLTINGGYISITAGVDGLDANGTIYMTKGTVIISAANGGKGNGGIDYDRSFELTGGLIVSSGGTQTPSDSSSQYSIIMTYPQMQKAGTLVSLSDDAGKEIVTFVPTKDYQTVVISSPELKKGSSYTLYSGGKSTGTEKNGLYTGGAYEGGTKITSFTIEDLVTWINESGVTEPQNEMMPGQGGGRGKVMNPDQGTTPGQGQEPAGKQRPNGTTQQNKNQKKDQL